MRRRRSSGGRRSAKLIALIFAALALAWLVFGDRLGPQPKLGEVDIPFGLCGERGGLACVIDGDTLAIGKRRIRLTGFDALEMEGACEAENARAREARSALHGWLTEGPFQWTADADTSYDRYGRELREARRGEETLADYMIEAGLAEGSGWGAVRRDWCAP